MDQKQPFTGRGLLLNLASRIITEPTRPLVLKTLYGFKMKIDPIHDAGVEKTIYQTGTYEAGTLHIFDYLLKPGDIFFDIGANIGLMTIFAAQKVRTHGLVYSFEPEPDTFKILEQNCEINHLENIYLNNFALGSEEKEGFIYPNIDINRGASSLVRKDDTNGKKIRITTLDAFLTGKGLHKIKLMKIDIEGYELEMLKGASNLLGSVNAPILCIEHSRAVLHIAAVEDVYDFICNVNHYRIFKFNNWKGHIGKLTEVFSKNEMPPEDNVFCFLPNHLLQIDPIIFN